MQSKITSFEDLVIWKKAQELAEKVYRLADENEFIRKDHKLKDQLKSASISISDNIAEGFEYNNNADFHRFLRIAKGSCGETRNKILFARRIEYIDILTANKLNDEAKQLGKQIGELIRKVKEKLIMTKRDIHALKSLSRNP